MSKNIHTADVIDIDGQVIAAARERQHYTVQHIVEVCCISEKMLRQIENGESSSFYSFPIKVQVARKIGAYLNLKDHEYMVVSDSYVDRDNSESTNVATLTLQQTLDLDSIKPEIRRREQSQKSIPGEQEAHMINEIDSIIEAYDGVESVKNRAPFNKILISSIDQDVVIGIDHQKKNRHVRVLMGSMMTLALIITGGFYYFQEARESVVVPAVIATPAEESLPVTTDNSVDNKSMGVSQVVQPIQPIIKPVGQ